MINTDLLATMKPGAILINTSRGALIDTNALIAALKAGRLGGVGLDIYELVRLLTFHDVLITSIWVF